MDDQFDIDQLKQVQEYARHIQEANTARNRMFDSLESTYLMDWGEENRLRQKVENVRITKSPDFRNKVQGAVRLLVATDPAFSIPKELNTEETMEVANELEQAADRIYKAASGVRGEPVHYDAVLSMILFSEIHIAITRTDDLVSNAQGGSRAAQIRAERVAARTPYVFDVWHPKTGYPDFDALGLRAFYREVETTSGAIMDEFGANGRALFPDGNRYKQVAACHFWDDEIRFSWLKGNERPLIQEKHGLPFIPIVCQLGEGSRLFEKPEHQRQPFAYALWKSGLADRQNLALTVLYTLVFNMGAVPLFAYKRNEPDKPLNVDWTAPGGVVYLDPTEEFAQVQKEVVDPVLLQALEIADNKAAESTIYGQTLGQPLEGGTPYSTVALLHQAGRLPLVVPQRKTSWALGEAVRMALLWAKEEKKVSGYADLMGNLRAKDIPDRFEVAATLDINLPQDELANAQAADIVSRGEDPLVSRQYAREHYLKIRQPEQMAAEVWDERAANLRAMDFFAEQEMKVRAKIEQMLAAAQARAMPQQPGVVQPGMEQPGTVPPEGTPAMPGVPQPGMNGGGMAPEEAI